LPRKQRDRAPQALTMRELQEVLALVQERSPSIANLCPWLAYSGWRISDAIDLKWAEIDLDRMDIDREEIKTSDRLTYPLTPALLTCVEVERGRLDGPPQGHVFREASGRPWGTAP